MASYAVRQARLSPTVLEEKNIVLASKGNRSVSSHSKWEGVKENKTIEKSLNTAQPLKLYSTGTLEKTYSFVIPDLRGLSLRQALRHLGSKGLKIKVQGSGRLLNSSPQKGERIYKNESITLVFD